jgi:D-3-phosphoglycerate dehydrogenase
MVKPPVAVTIRSFDPEGPAMALLRKEFEIVYLNTTGSRLPEDALIHAIEKAWFVIAGTESFSRRLLKTSPQLKAISRVGVGTDSIDLKTAEKQGVFVFNTPEAPARSVAEHTLALIFAILKHIPDYNTRVRRNDYTVRPGTLLQGKTIGVVGMGRIGSGVAAMLQALGCTIIYFDPFLRQQPSTPGTSVSSLTELVAVSDIITIHAAPPQDSRPLFNGYIFKQCKRGCIIINTSRGSLIDEHALEAALNDETVSAAGLDVFESEPYRGPLLGYPQVIVTPHIASNTTESRQQMEMDAVQHIVELKKRQLP